MSHSVFSFFSSSIVFEIYPCCYIQIQLFTSDWYTIFCYILYFTYLFPSDRHLDCFCLFALLFQATLQRTYSFPLKGLWKSSSGMYAEELTCYFIVCRLTYIYQVLHTTLKNDCKFMLLLPVYEKVTVSLYPHNLILSNFLVFVYLMSVKQYVKMS